MERLLIKGVFLCTKGASPFGSTILNERRARKERQEIGEKKYNTAIPLHICIVYFRDRNSLARKEKTVTRRFHC